MRKDKFMKKSFSEITKAGLAIVRKKLIEEEKRNNGYLVVSDKNGNIKKIPASEL